MPQPPWASGPREILQHGLSLLDKDSDSNRRLAMLSIDNAIELTLRTFLGLPRRVTGINVSRRKFQEISESFPDLLDAIEKHAGEKLEGINLGEIEFFHRLRNQLYHQGNGLTVARENVEIYAELARILFRNLFGFDVGISQLKSNELLGNFLATWVELEQTITKLLSKNIEKLEKLPKPDFIPSSHTHPPAWLTQLSGLVSQTIPYGLNTLTHINVISSDTAKEIEQLGDLRNQLIHGENILLSKEIVSKTKDIVENLKSLLN